MWLTLLRFGRSNLRTFLTALKGCALRFERWLVTRYNTGAQKLGQLKLVVIIE
jgi:hypothetical protein